MRKFFLAVFAMLFVSVALVPSAGSQGLRPWQGNASIPSNMFFEASLGNLPGIEVFQKFGKNFDIDIATVPETIWRIGGEYTGFPTGAAETMEVLSSDIDDNGSGAGAQTVLISELLDANGASSPDLTITLNGTTPVSLGAITYYRGAKIVVLTAGASGLNEGTISLRHTTTTANVFAVVVPGSNNTGALTYTVPLGKTLLVNSGSLEMVHPGGAATQASLALLARPFGGVFNQIVTPTITPTYSYKVNGNNFFVFLERTDIQMRCDGVSTNDTVVTSILSGLLVDN